MTAMSRMRMPDSQLPSLLAEGGQYQGNDNLEALVLAAHKSSIQRRHLFSIARFCSRFSTFLCCVKDLCIEAMQLPNRRDGAERWVDLICSFKATKQLHLASDFSTDIVHALQISESLCKTMLPALHRLYILQPGPRHTPLQTAVVSFMVSCRLLGHFIEVEYEQLRINEPREIGITCV